MTDPDALGVGARRDGHVPPELAAERRRIERLASEARRRAEHGSLRRRALVPAAVASGVLVGTGLLGVWARATPPATASTATRVATSTGAGGGAGSGGSSEEAFLADLRRTLLSDQHAIAGLAQVAATDFASSSSSPQAAGTTGSVPGAAPVAALPAVSLPAISIPPPVHATTGASGIP